MFVEAREQTGQIVQVSTHNVRRTVTRDHGERLFELKQAGSQLCFTVFGNRHRSIRQHAFVDIGFTEDGEYAGVSVLHVWRRVAFKRQHVVPVEDIVGGTVLGEIRVFHRANSHRVSKFLQLVSRHVRVLLGHQATRAFQRFIQQIGKLHGAARTGFERLTVFTQHHAEHVMFQRHGIRHITRFTHDSPRLHQMLMLTGVDVIQHAVRMQGFVTVFRTGDVGGGVKIAAILFLDDHAHRFAFLVFILIKEHHRCAFAFHRQIFSFQVRHNAWQHRVIQAFTHHVVTGQGHVQTIIGKLVLGHGNVHQLAPHLEEVRVSTLKFHHVAARALGEGFVFVIVLFGFTVETFQVCQRHFACVFLLLFFQIRDQHAELRAPVAYVVSADHLVTKELQGTHCRVTDDGGAQVTDVHLFRHVWRGVVNHHGLRFWLSHAQTVRFQRRVNVACQECRLKENVDKAWTGDFGFAGDAGEIQMRQYLLSELSRRHAQFFSHCHHAISLIVAKLYFR